MINLFHDIYLSSIINGFLVSSYCMLFYSQNIYSLYTVSEVIPMKGVICERIELPGSINIHSHSHAQLLLPLQGSIYIETDSSKHFIDESYLGFLPPECQHAYRGESGNEFLVLNIPENMVSKEDMENLHGASRLSFDERWRAIRYLIMSEASRSEGSAALNNLFYYFYNYLTEGILPESIKYINEHYPEDISIKDLAEIEHYNESYYCEWFKRKTNLSPMEYIKKLRVEKAKELLKGTDYSILQIAEQVGYSFNSSFSRIFKEMEGTAPATFRRNCRISAK